MVRRSGGGMRWLVRDCRIKWVEKFSCKFVDIVWSLNQYSLQEISQQGPQLRVICDVTSVCFTQRFLFTIHEYKATDITTNVPSFLHRMISFPNPFPMASQQIKHLVQDKSYLDHHL